MDFISNFDCLRSNNSYINNTKQPIETNQNELPNNVQIDRTVKNPFIGFGYYKPMPNKQFFIQNYIPYSKEKQNITAIPDIDTKNIDYTKYEDGILNLQGADLSKLDLRDKSDLLKLANFDNNTIFPSTDRLPENFNPQEIIEENKYAGLNIREMHEKGYTGKGVRVAILDQPLAINHSEFKDKIIHYEEIGYKKNTYGKMHGSAVTSILAGKTIGVAPESEVIYFAPHNYYIDKNGNNVTYNFPYTKALKKILEMNKNLQPEKRIQIVSVSWGFNKRAPDYPELAETLKQLKDSGVFVISTAIYDSYDGFNMLGLTQDYKKGLDNPDAYKFSKSYPRSPESFAECSKGNILLVPMDKRTTAAPTGENDYAYYGAGGDSWIVPYVAGLYAVVKQINPNITPQKFWEKALETGTPEYTQSGKLLGKIVNPLKLTYECSL